MTKKSYTVERDGSVTFHGEVDAKTRAKAYQEAAASRAVGTDVGDEVSELARESADLVVERETATEV